VIEVPDGTGKFTLGDTLTSTGAGCAIRPVAVVATTTAAIDVNTSALIDRSVRRVLESARQVLNGDRQHPK
jgi:hypothetical protein